MIFVLAAVGKAGFASTAKLRAWILALPGWYPSPTLSPLWISHPLERGLR